jgi:DNA-binding NtrC family response regulator
MNDKANILIVDDEEVVRLSHLRSLEGTECNARSVEDGKEAILVMEQSPFDVVPDSEVVVITGYPSIESAKQAVRLGAHNYLTKPVEPNDVIKAAHDAMNQKRWALRSDRKEQPEFDFSAQFSANELVTH